MKKWLFGSTEVRGKRTHDEAFRVTKPLNVCIHRVDENESVKCFTFIGYLCLVKAHSEKWGGIGSIL